ncbi:hypothetical protein GCM10023335_77270 [Streptomyces siamensis]|uniref:Uncharacterized protein n=1 Tax=Streptomyces siamensis TaxID=1274986 RepID=A0ABP9JKP5_9ACTN
MDDRSIGQLVALADLRLGDLAVLQFADLRHLDAGHVFEVHLGQRTEWSSVALTSQWYRSYGNENRDFGEDGLMRVRLACINDLPIAESDCKYHWPLGRRPDDHPGLSDLGF